MSVTVVIIINDNTFLSAACLISNENMNTMNVTVHFVPTITLIYVRTSYILRFSTKAASFRRAGLYPNPLKH